MCITNPACGNQSYSTLRRAHEPAQRSSRSLRDEIDKEGEQRGDNDPEELIPVKEGYPRQFWIFARIERHPECRDKRDDQQQIPKRFSLAPPFPDARCVLKHRVIRHFKPPVVNQEQPSEQYRSTI